jgi:transcriptional regulator with XRE-family HTH domain
MSNPRSCRADDSSESRQKEQELIRLGQAIRQVREQQGVSTSELATATGITRQRIDRLEAGKVNPPLDVLIALADGLGVRASAFIMRAEQL